ncbi:hypothetical protein ACMD2_23799, partial [Ananas comosus]
RPSGPGALLGRRLIASGPISH